MAVHPLTGEILEDDTDVDEVEELDEVDESEDSQEDEEDDEKLREAGRKALRAERSRVKQLERENKVLKAANAKNAKTAEPVVDEDSLRQSIRAELAQEYGVKTAHAEAVNVLSEFGYLGNAARGVKSLDLASFVVDGDVDTEALRDAVEEWKEDEPRLFKQQRSRQTSQDADDEDEAPRGRRADLGRKQPRQKEDNPLAQALNQMVGGDRTRLL